MTQVVFFASQRHGYCTLGEAFNRLDFSSAILDSRRFNYVVRVSEGLGFILLWWRLWTAHQLADGKHWQREIQACEWGCWAFLRKVIDGILWINAQNRLFDLLKWRERKVVVM